jgi:hypothetical protein
MKDSEPIQNPMNHPAEPPTGADGVPKFGRLLLVLLLAILVVVAMTFVSEALYM